jgi:hypothetical protein
MTRAIWDFFACLGLTFAGILAAQMWFWPEKLRFEPWMIFAPQIVVAGIMHIVRDQRAQKGGVA